MEQVLVAFAVLVAFVASSIIGFRIAVGQVKDHCEGDTLVVAGVIVGFLPAFIVYGAAFILAILDPAQGSSWLLGGLLLAWAVQIPSMVLWGIALEVMESLGLVHSPIMTDLLEGANKHKVRWYGRR